MRDGDSDASFDSFFLSIGCPQRVKASAKTYAHTSEMVRRAPRAAEEHLHEHWEQSMKIIIHSHDYIWRTCAHCAVKRRKMQKCGGCRLTHYCSTRCQHRAWAEHKWICTPDGPLPKRNNYIRLNMSGQHHCPSAASSTEEDRTKSPSSANVRALADASADRY